MVAYFEIGGSGLMLSANMEKQLQKHPGLGIRAGACVFRSDGKGYLTLPIGINYLIKTNKKTAFIEASLTATWTKADVHLYTIVDRRDPQYVNRNEWNFVPAIGYRKQSEKNWLTRFNFAPVINQYGFLPYFGFSFGRVF